MARDRHKDETSLNFKCIGVALVNFEHRSERDQSVASSSEIGRAHV